MTHDSQVPRRRSIRLKEYDYSLDGAYYVTICTKNRVLFFNDIAIRAIAEKSWLEIPLHFSRVEMDEWVVMPNHLHGIIIIRSAEDGERHTGVQLNAPTTRVSTNHFSAISPAFNSLSVAIRTYKAAVTVRCRLAGHGDFSWQRNYYEHVIRDEHDLNNIREYIINNPARWHTDEDNPDRKTTGVSLV